MYINNNLVKYFALFTYLFIFFIHSISIVITWYLHKPIYLITIFIFYFTIVYLLHFSRFKLKYIDIFGYLYFISTIPFDLSKYLFPVFFAYQENQIFLTICSIILDIIILLSILQIPKNSNSRKIGLILFCILTIIIGHCCLFSIAGLIIGLLTLYLLYKTKWGNVMQIDVNNRDYIIPINNKVKFFISNWVALDFISFATYKYYELLNISVNQKSPIILVFLCFTMFVITYIIVTRRLYQKFKKLFLTYLILMIIYDLIFIIPWK